LRKKGGPMIPDVRGRRALEPCSDGDRGRRGTKGCCLTNNRPLCGFFIVLPEGIMSWFTDFLSDNSVLISAQKEEEELRKVSPHLLLDGEKVEFAFQGRGGKGRDHHILTDRRLLVKDVQGITGKQVQYISYPYKNVKAWCTPLCHLW